MLKKFLSVSLVFLHFLSYSQERSLDELLSDSAMVHASVSFCIRDVNNGELVMDYNSEKSLAPASVQKLITTAAVLELLGPNYTFRTSIGYTGTLNRRSGRLSGDIVIKGGGDPVLGSNRFADHYGDFITHWTNEIANHGIKRIKGRVMTDDTYYDYLPVPAKWLWEDAGNYYGAGAFGLSVYDNTYEIHFKTSSDSLSMVITGIVPEECSGEFSNWLVAAGTADEGYVFAAPYSTNGWLAGTIPTNMEDFVLKAAIPDPPRIIAEITDKKLKELGIRIEGNPSTTRLQLSFTEIEITPVSTIVSPPLNEIIEKLNHESVNLYAEHLIKELGKTFMNKGSTASGVEVIRQFLTDAGIDTDGMFIEDGSGLSPMNAINAKGVTDLLLYLKKRGKYFNEFYSSLPDAGKEGTLKNYFKDPVFDSRLAAKSGSITRVRSFAGYFSTLTGREMAFCILVNDYNGDSRRIIAGIEEIIKETILYR